MRARLVVVNHLSTTLRWGNPVWCLSQRHNKRSCLLASHYPFNAERQANEVAG